MLSHEITLLEAFDSVPVFLSGEVHSVMTQGLGCLICHYKLLLIFIYNLL